MQARQLEAPLPSLPYDPNRGGTDASETGLGALLLKRPTRRRSRI